MRAWKIILLLTFYFTTETNSQNVGIGTTTPGYPLSFSNALGDKISLWGTSANHYGLGVQSGLLQIHSDAPFANIGLGYGSSDNFIERMRIINEGEDGMSLDGRIILKNGTFPLNTAAGGGVWMYKADNSSLLGFMGVQNNQNLGFYGGSGGWGFVYDAVNSRVGIGNSSPVFKLDVSGDINITGKLNINGSSGNAGQILKSNGANTPSSWDNIQYKQVFLSGFFGTYSSYSFSYCPISQNNIPNTIDLGYVEYIMPYSGKIESINVKAQTLSSAAGLVNTITLQLFRNGNPFGGVLVINSPLPILSSANFSININTNFTAGDRFVYRMTFTESTTTVKLNASMAVSFN